MSIHLKFHCVIAWIESDSTDYFLKPLVNRTVFTLEQKIALHYHPKILAKILLTQKTCRNFVI